MVISLLPKVIETKTKTIKKKEKSDKNLQTWLPQSTENTLMAKLMIPLCWVRGHDTLTLVGCFEAKTNTQYSSLLCHAAIPSS